MTVRQGSLLPLSRGNLIYNEDWGCQVGDKDLCCSLVLAVYAVKDVGSHYKKLCVVVVVIVSGVAQKGSAGGRFSPYPHCGGS